jgi:NAD(P)H-dependent FMN reductase
MLTVLGLSGSLRAGSFNTALLRAAAKLMPPGCVLELATLHGIPLYDGDAEARDGIAPAVQALKDRIVDAKVKEQLKQFLQGFVDSLGR